MTDKKPSKRQHRPRIDAVIRHIEGGSYDEEIGRLLTAIENRRIFRQKRVMDLVRDVYGEDFEVQRSRRSPNVEAGVRPNPFMPQPTDAGTTDEWIEAEKRAREQEEAMQAEGLGDDDVSNSPIIGSVDISASSDGTQEN